MQLYPKVNKQAELALEFLNLFFSPVESTIPVEDFQYWQQLEELQQNTKTHSEVTTRSPHMISGEFH